MLDDSDVFSIHVDAARPLKVFASACSGIYRSSNSGSNWTKLNGAQSASYRTYQITQDPTRVNTLYASTTLGLTKSVDGGATWRRLSAQTTRSIAFDPFHTGRIFVATDEGLFRSDDRGESLRAVNRGFTNRRLSSLGASGKTLYVNSLQNSAGRAIFRRLDSEQTWARVPVRSDLSSPGIEKQTGNHQADNFQIFGVVATTHNGFLAATSRGLMRSDDGEMTWQPVEGTLAGNTVTAICNHPARAGVFFASTFGVIFVSTDEGRSWRLLTESDGTAVITELFVAAEIPDKIFALTRNRGVYAVALPNL
jgi:ligand-binding sensor domain-containing protein